MTILFNDNLIAFWYIEYPAGGLDWRMGLVRLPSGVPQLASRVRNYADPTYTGYFKDGNPYLWNYTTGRPGDSVAVGLHTGRDWAKEMSRRWRHPVFEVVRGPFEPTEAMASRIQRDLFISPPMPEDIDYDDTIRRWPLPRLRKAQNGHRKTQSTSRRG